MDRSRICNDDAHAPSEAEPLRRFDLAIEFNSAEVPKRSPSKIAVSAVRARAPAAPCCYASRLCPLSPANALLVREIQLIVEKTVSGG
jgi:hypothetical protein